MLNRSSSKRVQTAQDQSINRRKRKLRALNGDKTKELKAIDLESPTSISMKNSFIIKNADPSFEQYYNLMKKRKNLLTQNSFLNSDPNNQNKIPGRRPAPRDGHTGVVV